MMTSFALLMPATTTAQTLFTSYPPISSPFRGVDFFNEPWYEPSFYSSPCYGNLCRSSKTAEWFATTDSYKYQLRLPDLEPDSVAAEMAADSSSIKVMGKRRYDGCTCEPREVRQISLPYRPRAEDVNVSFEEGLLTLELARHSKADTAVPLKVKVKAAPAEKQSEPLAGTETESDTPRGARPLRFVPHESASASALSAEKSDHVSDVEAQEKGLMDKFRVASRVASALTTTSDAATSEEPDATSTEHSAADVKDDTKSGAPSPA